MNSFAAMKDVEVAYICDIDSSRAEKAAAGAEKIGGRMPKVASDLRRVLDEGAVDAVIIATPDHWHAPAAILACEAGKHVYVEKPASHNIREGRLMIEAARRQKRVVQVGMQSRSAPHVKRAIELVRSGTIGEVLSVKVWNSQLRGNIGRRNPSDPPAGVDYDLWVGPAPFLPYQANRFHGVWRWWHNFGTGDMGNDGVHDIDCARWGLGVEGHPSSIAAIGGKYFFDDDQEFPDTQTVVCEYELPGGKKKQLIFEQRIWSPYFTEGAENGMVFYGTKGMLNLNRGKGFAMEGPRNAAGEKMTGRIDGAVHHRDWLKCIREGGRPICDIEEGHLSAAVCHLGNIATRVGRVIRFDAKQEKIMGDEEAGKLVRREYREGHWAVPKGA
jgi:predicted dehydrogenase